MAYDLVYSEEPPVIITEADDGFFHIYVEGELMGIAYEEEESYNLAEEILKAILGDPLEEEA